MLYTCRGVASTYCVLGHSDLVPACSSCKGCASTTAIMYGQPCLYSPINCDCFIVPLLLFLVSALMDLARLCLA